VVLTLTTRRPITDDEEALIAAGLRLGAVAAEYRQLDFAVTGRHLDTPPNGAHASRVVTLDDRPRFRIDRGGCSDDMRAKRQIARDLRRAVERNQLALFYQPQVCLNDGFVGMEALIRWRHPTMGTLEPDKFIAIAEETGLIMPVGEWVISEACRQCAEWNRRIGRPVKVAINVSALQLYFSDLPEIVAHWLRVRELPGNCLEIEITETAVMHSAEEAAMALQRLRNLGVSVAIDDFGIGYSSLGYLAELPVDLLKIDRMFLRQIHSEATETVVRGIAALGHSLGLSIVAEGVETPEQWDKIRTIGVDIAQGFYIGRPMQPTEAFDWMKPRFKGGRFHVHSNE
jgi:EAL domain-containing protein (putative c-di-GMP-specific phosphodiesterase class I)